MAYQLLWTRRISFGFDLILLAFKFKYYQETGSQVVMVITLQSDLDKSYIPTNLKGVIIYT